MIQAQLKELILQALGHEGGGVLIYQTAIECAVDARAIVVRFSEASETVRQSFDTL